MQKHSRTRAITSICHPTDDPKDTYLLQQIHIACELCEGQATYQIVGHHIPAVLRALQKAMELYPDLCREIVTEIPKDATLVIPHTKGEAN